MNRDTQTVAFSRIAGNLRFLFAAIYLLCYFMGALFLILKLVGFEVSNEVLIGAIISLFSGLLIQFVLQEVILFFLHKTGKTVFTPNQLKIGKKTYDLNQVDVYYYKPPFDGGMIRLPQIGYMKMDTHDDVFVHGALTGVEVGIFTKREVKKIIEKTGAEIHIL